MSNERTIVNTDLESIFHWDYSVKFPQMDKLYENAKRDQWNVSTTLNWDRPIEKEVLDMTMMPMFQTELYRSLSEDNKLQLGRKFAAWRLSQFLHGEQGALMVCGQLVDAVPDLDAKMNAAAQVFDEARHVEGFRKYITKLDRIYPIDPTLERLLRAIMRTIVGSRSTSGCKSSPRASRSRRFVSCSARPRTTCSRNCSSTS